MQGKVIKKWTLKDEPENDLLTRFAQETNIPFSLSKILINRGITSKPAARQFFVPELSHLHDPFLMKGMDIAVERMLRAIESKEKILIFGDYDVDGTSGVSMFHVFLNKLNVPNTVFIPDRFTDGYGVSNTGIDQANNEGIKLIITIDCGITAYEKVEYANSLGIDVIICDHHQPPAKVPNAYAILDPMQTDCNYPFKSLCGAGVAFKLVQGVCQKLNIEIWKDLMDFVAIATAADMVSVTDENRVILHFGFKHIRENPRASYRVLVENAGFKLENLTTSNVVFALGPRINAVGRLGDAKRAVEFLTCEDVSQIGDLAQILESENTDRKKIDSEIYIQAQEFYEEYKISNNNGNDDVAIVLHNPDWHPGVLGIIASRMVEKYYKPAIILTTFNGNAKGSARSINHFNIYDALRNTSSEFSGLVQFGGHFHAAGLEIDALRVDEFRSTFNRVAKGMIDGNQHGGQEILIPEITIDAELNTGDINLRFIKILKHFEPFGPGNMTPLFVSKNMQVVGEPRVYHNSTFVFKVRKKSSNGSTNAFDKNVFDCIYYQAAPANADEQLRIPSGSALDIVYSVEENHWNGKTKTQLRIRDFKLSIN